MYGMVIGTLRDECLATIKMGMRDNQDGNLVAGLSPYGGRSPTGGDSPATISLTPFRGSGSSGDYDRPGA